MTRMKLPAACCLGLLLFGSVAAARADLIPKSDLDHMSLKRYWDAKLALNRTEMVTRIVLLDENLYVLTDENRVFCVHANTGVLRWSRTVAEPGQVVRGPTHSNQFVFFSTPGDIRVINRATGESKGEPRPINGVIIDVAHDVAEVNVGSLHGLRGGETLDVFRGSGEGLPLAQLKITQVNPRYSKGKLTTVEASRRAQVGDKVRADLVLPLRSVRLPFAPSCAAVADDNNLYYGAANGRFYSLEILSSFERWQVRTPRTVTGTPYLTKEDLYYAGQDGLVVSCTKADRVKNWTFQTEGPVFADLEVTPTSVFVASSDRSLYCLDRVSGNRVWRERMDMPLSDKPIAADGQVYQQVPDYGLFVLDSKTGKTQWRRETGGQYLMQAEKTAYLWTGGNGQPGKLVAVNAEKGDEKGSLSTSVFGFAAGSRADQTILMVSRAGDMFCARAKNAPPLKPAQLAEVLKSDRAAKIKARMDEKAKADEKAREEKPKVLASSRLGRFGYLMDDLFRSPRDRADGEGAAKPTTTTAKAEEGDKAEKPEGDEEKGGDEAKPDEGKDDEGKGDDAKSGDDDKGDDEGKSGEDKKDEKKKDDKKKKDKKGDDDDDNGDDNDSGG